MPAQFRGEQAGSPGMSGLPLAPAWDREPEGWDGEPWDSADQILGASVQLSGTSVQDDWDPDAGAPPSGAAFAQGAWGDGLAPDPVLATVLDLAWREGLDQLDDDQLTGLLQAANRLASWSAALKLAATSGLAARREADGNKTGDWRSFDHVDDEVAVALTLTRRSAGRLLELALGLDRLPLTRAALAAGLIDERRAEVIAEELSGLDDAHAAAVEKLLIGKAPGLTTGQLRALARRLVISADPAAARRRKEAALRDARVEAFTEHAGTAGLSGRDMCPVDVLAADKHLTALAQAMKAAGIIGTMDTLRAHAYLYLLSGHPVSDLFPRGTAASATPDPTNPGSRPPSPPGDPASAPPDPGGPGALGRAARDCEPHHAPDGVAGLDPVPGRCPRLRPPRRRRLPHPRGPAEPQPRQPVVRHPHRPCRTPRRARLQSARLTAPARTGRPRHAPARHAGQPRNQRR